MLHHISFGIHLLAVQCIELLMDMFLVIATTSTLAFLIAAISAGSGTVDVGICADATEANNSNTEANSFFIGLVHNIGIKYP